MFKETNIVITPLGVPAIVCEVIDNGSSYKVDEMPILSEAEIQGILMGTIENELIEGKSKSYRFDELRCPTEEEKNNDIITNLLEQGCTFPELSIN